MPLKQENRKLKIRGDGKLKNKGKGALTVKSANDFVKEVTQHFPNLTPCSSRKML